MPAGVPDMSGYNEYGSLGFTSLSNNMFAATTVPGVSGVVAASTSDYHTLALLSNGDRGGMGRRRAGRALARGSYRLSATAGSPEGTSAARTATFTVTR